MLEPPIVLASGLATRYLSSIGEFEIRAGFCWKLHREAPLGGKSAKRSPTFRSRTGLEQRRSDQPTSQHSLIRFRTYSSADVLVRIR